MGIKHNQRNSPASSRRVFTASPSGNMKLSSVKVEQALSQLSSEERNRKLRAYGLFLEGIIAIASLDISKVDQLCNEIAKTCPTFRPNQYQVGSFPLNEYAGDQEALRIRNLEGRIKGTYRDSIPTYATLFEQSLTNHL